MFDIYDLARSLSLKAVIQFERSVDWPVTVVGTQFTTICSAAYL